MLDSRGTRLQHERVGVEFLDAVHQRSPRKTDGYQRDADLDQL